ncbi:hypothetical protein N7447_008348 [Penicillium robsamsonii]|uniref:uncharacterized protein n=1 Tax=Penicillium robsamsonii TaxID=1792511 RepID=UPI002547A765|nr:uncharacterized protein N7447_008348 [Penicillium robsamsonii]KAJ5816115.1 hypothetical protein N7447_008348 [Penicillium robsamsonii]
MSLNACCTGVKEQYPKGGSRQSVILPAAVAVLSIGLLVATAISSEDYPVEILCVAFACWTT